MGISAIFRDEIDSTQDEALRLAEAGTKGPLLVQAGRQTAGRGRGGRGWHSPGGGVHATLLITEPLLAIQRSWLPLLSCFAWVEALDEPAKIHAIQCKWPNDLYLNGRKVGGQLVDLRKLPSGEKIALIGSGINVAPVELPPDFDAEGGLGNEPTSLEGEGIDTGKSLQELASSWAEALLAFLGVARSANATENLIGRGDSLLWARGCRVEFLEGGDAPEPWRATILGLGAGGALRVRAENDGEHRLVHDASLRLAAGPSNA